MMAKASVVLVHGAWADGSGFRAVYDQLIEWGIDVHVVQNPTTSLSDDVTVTRNQLDSMSGPVVLVGHSWGGFVVTEAGNHENVAALVYLTAFAPDSGQSQATLTADFPKTGPQPPILEPVNGFSLLDASKFPSSFAADVPSADASFMARSQIPFGVKAFSEEISTAAWRSKPSWYLHVTDDRMIPPEAQLEMAQRMGARVTSVPGNHAIYVSNPQACSSIILEAVDAVS